MLLSPAAAVDFQECRHLRALRVHDGIEAEVQIGVVELEQLLQQSDQSIEPFAHRSSSHSARIGTALKRSPKPALVSPSYSTTPAVNRFPAAVASFRSPR